MHTYYDDDADKIDWQGIEDAAYFIGWWLARWGRMNVSQCKEKFGTTRVYCSFGWDSLYSIYRPRHAWIPSWWPHRLDFVISGTILPILNRFVIPIQERLYAWRYGQTIKKWPHLKEEILCGADYPELLRRFQ